MLTRMTCLTACLLLAACGSKPKTAAAPPSDVKAITGATLLDGRGGEPIPDAVILVRKNRIEAVGPRSAVRIPPGAEVVDTAGKFVTPGLIDLHVHLGSTGAPGFRPADYTVERIERNLRQYLAFGVTTVRSVGTERDAGFEVRKAQREGRLFGARLFTAGRGFTAPGGHPSQEVGEIARQPATPEDARKQVQELAAQKVDVIKIWADAQHGRQAKVSNTVIDAILAEAAKHSIPVTAHIFDLADVQHMTANGAAGFLHMVRDTDNIDDATIQQLKQKSILFTPTLVRQELAWFYDTRSAVLQDTEVQRVFEHEVRKSIAEFMAGKKATPIQQLEFDRAKRNARKLSEAGIPMGIGSDGGSSHDLPGIMTHREMEIFAEAGFRPGEILTAATRNGALALGKSAEVGSIEPGKLADLLVLTADPARDVRNLRKIERLMLDGSWVDRTMLP